MSVLLADKLGIKFRTSREKYGVIGNTDYEHIGVATLTLQFANSPKLRVEVRIA
jgi:hypothetical protein